MNREMRATGAQGARGRGSAVLVFELNQAAVPLFAYLLSHRFADAPGAGGG